MFKIFTPVFLEYMMEVFSTAGLHALYVKEGLSHANGRNGIAGETQGNVGKASSFRLNSYS